MNLEDRFIKSVTHLANENPKPEVFKAWLSHTYESMVKTYNGYGRFYHTMIHVEYMLTNLDKYFMNLLDETQRAKVELAIWFHDLIYDVSFLPGVNEALSANQFGQFGIDALIPDDVIKEISEMIMFTTHTEYPVTLEQKVLCDLDLLGLHGQAYWDNRDNVHQEYTTEFDEEEWLEGRLKFLDWMLAKEQIFHTGLFQKHFEQSARDNLLKEKRYFYA